MSLPSSSKDQAHPVLGYLAWPKTVLVLQILFCALAFNYVGQFGFDASSETLVVEGDPDLVQYEQVVDVFGGDAFLFLTFRPSNGRAIEAGGLETLREIVVALRSVEGVKSVFSILDAPLLKSPPVTLAQVLENIPTVLSADADLTLAHEELRSSPFFAELLITRDGSASAIKIDLADETASPVRRHALIDDIRAIQTDFSGRGTLYLGGVPMIADDMVTFVKRDLTIFGGIVVGLVVLALSVFFRSTRWVVLPLVTAAISVFYTVGLLGALGWQATVISSNFISLLGITTISLTIHLIVHYRELQHTEPDRSHAELVVETMAAKFLPCLYTALTTIAAFGSLTVSGILPVEDFGWMMCTGIVVAFVTTYMIFPALLLLSDRIIGASNLGQTNDLLRGVGEFVRWRTSTVILIGVICAFGAYIGITKVSLDNRFVDYFDTDTEINRGMRFIDEHLGGTIPFDVVLYFDAIDAGQDEQAVDSYQGLEEDEFTDDEFADDEFGSLDFAGDTFTENEFGADEFAQDEFGVAELDQNRLDDVSRYWFTRGKLDELERIHRFLESKAYVGKVLSLTSLEDFALEFTEGRKLTSLEIVGILSALPPGLQSQIIDPYADPETGQMRLSGRIVESGPSFDREAFRQEIIALGGELTLSQDVAVTGMMVLFNTMLSQLLSSQLNTLVYILLIVFVMFLVLLRSWRYALVGMVPNTLASAMVIGAMGYAGIPLDMMTTTIAAICIGIGVDDTIHYLHRFREEYDRHGDPRVAVSFSHESIGRALLYTSLTVVIGFSVLGFSNFVPTVMFGLWTAVAMVLALIANITVLPALLVITHGQKPVDPKIRSDVAVASSPSEV
ncbi:MAG: MMPL family transporter [Pseudomonadales bacterium]|nr:MMPL family transporter [Pseudomonadales bacterium]